eukprot:1479041-Rhodomonas_salina.1
MLVLRRACICIPTLELTRACRTTSKLLVDPIASSPEPVVPRKVPADPPKVNGHNVQGGGSTKGEKELRTKRCLWSDIGLKG